MKKIFLSASLILATATAAQANEVYADPVFADGLTSTSATVQEWIDDCLSEISSSKAIRACSKLIKGAPPKDDLKANLYTRRALHKMSLGRFDDASTDFRRAGEFSENSDMAALGNGFAAMFQNDLETARHQFAESQDTEQLAPLAAYGMGLTYEMDGDAEAARAAYEDALELRPSWDAVQEKVTDLDKQ